MSSGITFYDYREAREYQEMLLREGINSHLASMHGKYTVTPKEGKPIKIFNISQKKMEEYRGKGVTGFHAEGEGEHGVWFTKDTTTKAKLHEIGHAKHEHTSTGGIRFGDKVDRELDAEIYAWEQMSKKLTPHVAFNAVRQAYIWNPRMDYISVINTVARKLEERGIPVTKEDKKWLFDTTLAKTDDPELEEWKEQVKEEF